MQEIIKTREDCFLPIVNAIPLVNEPAVLHLLLYYQPFRTSVTKVVTIKNLTCFEISETVESSCNWLKAFVEVSLREIGNPLETGDMVEV